jgi:hypothetical protein
VVDRFVARRAVDAADQGIGRIVPEGNVSAALDTTEVVSNCLSDKERDGDAPALRLILKLPVRVLGESKIRRHVLCHRGNTVPRYRDTVNDAGARLWPRDREGEPLRSSNLSLTSSGWPMVSPARLPGVIAAELGARGEAVRRPGRSPTARRCCRRRSR